MNKILLRVIVICLLMISASVSAILMKPTHKIAQDGTPVNLEEIIPRNFGNWREVELNAGIVNPQQKQELERIYSQTLSRTYKNSNGEYVMLSIAYGEDQSDSNQLHLPDVCYPAQGFQVRSSSKAKIQTAYGSVSIKRLFTVLGARNEPLTYWTTVGDKVAIGGKAVKLEQLKYGFSGKIPDGLIFRVSTITSDESYGYSVQEKFIKDIIETLDPQNRKRIAGLYPNL